MFGMYKELIIKFLISGCDFIFNFIILKKLYKMVFIYVNFRIDLVKNFSKFKMIYVLKVYIKV